MFAEFSAFERVGRLFYSGTIQRLRGKEWPSRSKKEDSKDKLIILIVMCITVGPYPKGEGEQVGSHEIIGFLAGSPHFLNNLGGPSQRQLGMSSIYFVDLVTRFLILEPCCDIHEPLNKR